MTSSQRDDSNSPEKPDSLNTDTNVGIEKLRAKLFHLNGLCLPTDHQCTYEPGRNDTQILDETMSLILLDRSQREEITLLEELTIRADEIGRQPQSRYGIRRLNELTIRIFDLTAQLEALKD